MCGENVGVIISSQLGEPGDLVHQLREEVGVAVNTVLADRAKHMVWKMYGGAGRLGSQRMQLLKHHFPLGRGTGQVRKVIEIPGFSSNRDANKTVIIAKHLDGTQRVRRRTEPPVSRSTFHLTVQV